MFSELHSRTYLERKDRIEHTTNLEELPWFDRIEPDSPEYWDLDLIEQELILEKTNEDFQLVLTRLEKKPEEEKIQALEKMMDIRSRQTKKTRKTAEIDVVNGNIIDSSQILGANIIIKFIERKKKSFEKRLTRRGTKIKG